MTPLGTPDPGRPEGIRRLRESRFNLLGSYSDDSSRVADAQRIALASGSDGEFKVPTLRNLMLMAPYGHDGGVDTIAEVVRRHARDGRARGLAESHPARADRPGRLPRVVEHVLESLAP